MMLMLCLQGCFSAKNYRTRQPSILHRARSMKKPPRLASFIVFSMSDESKMDHPPSASYHPSIWDPNLIESLSPSYTHESHYQRLEELKRNAKELLTSSTDPAVLLNNIDAMQRLGVAYHFETEIKEALGVVHSFASSDLYTAALQFRLLRENGFRVSSDIFAKFRSRNGRFMDSLSQDTEALLSLYEASYLGIQGEEILEEAKDFSFQYLKSSVRILDSSLFNKVQQSLEIPLHWRVPSLEAQSFIDHYQISDSKNLTLLELAKLDYNIVQSIYQLELKELSRWWRKLGFKDKLSFARDQLMENYLWAVGIIFEPQYSKCRIGLTKFVSVLTAIDDIFDVYGRPDELECFTAVLNRWDINEIDDLPEYMKICYVALFNFANELVYDALKDHGLIISPYIQQEWVRLCRSYLLEAQWFSSNHVPTMEHYLNNAWISVGGPAMIVHAYPMLGCTLSEETLDALKNSKITYWSSLITRLWNDLKDSKDESNRGDVAKSIECFMAEKRVSREEAEAHARGLIEYSWKKINEEIAKSSLPNPTVKMLLNMARTAHYIYQHGDGISTSTWKTRDHLMSLLVNPTPIQKPI